MKTPDETTDLRLRPRTSEAVAIDVPTDTMQVVRRVAAERDMSPEALLKLYIGEGLRRDAEPFAGSIRERSAAAPGTQVASGVAGRAPLDEIRGEAAD